MSYEQDYPLPAEYDRQKSRTVQKRSNTGESYVEVNRHGRGYVGGSLTERSRSFIGPVLTGHATMSADRIRAALETAPVTIGGFRDSIAISKLTDVIYPDLPRLVGADTIAYEEQQGANIIGPVRAMARPPRVTLGRIDRRAVAAGYVRYSHELLSPTDDGRVFVGHAAIIPLKVTVRAAAAAAAEQREADRVTLSEAMPLPVAIAVRATGLLPGDSLTWSHRGLSGTLSRSKSSRFSATVSGHAVRSQRTVKGLQRQVAALTA